MLLAEAKKPCSCGSGCKLTGSRVSCNTTIPSAAQGLAPATSTTRRRAAAAVAGPVEGHVFESCAIDHPHVGAMTLDSDVLSVVGNDLRILVYTAQPCTEDADHLAVLSVIGTQTAPHPAGAVAR
ncbi:hypothetical protein IU479_27030 [Nocardia abscessus]|uniref:MmyB family transcriptional regulator n=1 Tax=Nocardia abscessus TaxID=120957 RepID=UPI0018959A03|nr:hypothetical protein [Nocardia abscessus]MBF6221755.1 hypothetical protein [Nocardia abscessus]